MLNVYGLKINDDGKYDRDTYATSCGDFYLHGELAMINGCDLCGIEEIPEEGIHKCNVYIDGYVYKGDLFCWLAPFGGSYRKRGYVVMIGDTEAEYMLEIYKRKRKVMQMKIKTTRTIEGVNLLPLTISELYDFVVTTLGYDKEKIHYDCTKIEVSDDIADLVEEKYRQAGQEKGVSESCIRLSFGMDWCCSGPMVNEKLDNGTIVVYEGFIKEGE